MIDERQRYERSFEIFEMPEPAFDRMVDRRERERRRQRIAAGMLALVIAIAGVWTFLSVTRPMTRTGRSSPTPSAPSLSEIRYHGMGLNYVIPSGWDKTFSFVNRLTLEGPDAHDGHGQLTVGANIWAPDGCIQGVPCPATPAAMASWIRANASVRSEPIVTTSLTTSRGPVEAVQVDAFALVEERPVTLLHGIAQVAPGSRVRFLLFSVDTAMPRTYVITIAAPEERFESFLPRAMGVVSRMEFGVFDHRSHGA